MGVDIATWRAKIGTFIPRTRRRIPKYGTISGIGSFLSMTLRLTVLVSLLILAGDIEQNPGPGPSNSDSDQPNALYKGYLQHDDPTVTIPRTTKWRMSKRMKLDIANEAGSNEIAADNPLLEHIPDAERCVNDGLGGTGAGEPEASEGAFDE
jgi:hypothetical protein